MMKKMNPMQTALASRRGRGIDLTIILGSPEEKLEEQQGNDLVAPGAPEDESSPVDVEGEEEVQIEPEIEGAEEVSEEPMGDDGDLLAGLSPQDRQRIMTNPQSLKDRVLKAALERAKG